MSRPLFTTFVDSVSELALYVSVALIVVGVTTPSVYKPGFLWGGDTYSVFTAIERLHVEGYSFLSVIVFVFSVVFPLLKSLVAATLFRLGAGAPHWMVKWLKGLGKWSMLDVFLVATLIALTQLASPLKIEPRFGLYLFCTGVLLNNLATMRLPLSARPPTTQKSVELQS